MGLKSIFDLFRNSCNVRKVTFALNIRPSPILLLSALLVPHLSQILTFWKAHSGKPQLRKDLLMCATWQDVSCLMKTVQYSRTIFLYVSSKLLKFFFL